MSSGIVDLLVYPTFYVVCAACRSASTFYERHSTTEWSETPLSTS